MNIHVFNKILLTLICKTGFLKCQRLVVDLDICDRAKIKNHIV